MNNPILDAKRTITQYYDNLARNNAGEVQRAINRKTHLVSIHRKTLAIVEKHTPKMSHAMPDATGFDQKWSDINADLLSHLSNYADYHRAINFVAHVLQQGNNRQVWSVKLPPSLINIKRDRPLRTKKWFLQAKMLAKFHQNWLCAIDDRSYIIDKQHSDNLFVALILSAVFYCGANHKSTLLAFVAALKNKSKLLNIGDYYYFDLIIDDNSFNSNIYGSDGQANTVLRLFINLQTSALIKQWYKSAPADWQYPTTEQHLKSLLNSHLKAYEFNISSVGLFCKAAISITENQPNARIPQALIEYATARNKSYSLANQNWLSIWGRQPPTLPPMALSDFKTVPSIQVDNRPMKTATRCHHYLHDFLTKALRPRVDGVKRSPRMAITAIKTGLDNIDLSAQEALLVNWLLSVLTIRKLSTAARYHSAIGGIWLAITIDIELNQYDADDFFELYESAVEMAKSAKDYCYKASRLQQMHQYGVMFEGLEPLPENLVTGNESRPHTRAGFVDETLFSALVNCVGQFTDQTLYQRQQLQALLIVGYRTGMRLGELIKLRLMDIEPDDIGWLFVRNNKYGNNKSNAARRKIPLFTLLTPVEEKLVSAHIQNKRVFSKPNTLLFSEAQTSSMPMERQQISNMTGQLLRQLAPDCHFVFHHLRHSALTRLQLVINIELFEHNFNESFDASFAAQILPYSYQQSRQIKQQICGANQRSVYWCLAVFAGHRSPQTSFSRYYHCSDILFFEHLRQVKMLVTFNQARAFSGIGIHQLRKVFNKQERIDFAILKEVITPKLASISLKQSVKQTEKQHRLEPTKAQQDIPAICYHLLSALEKGENIQLLASKYRIQQTKIEQWLRNALAIKQRLNYKGKTRLFSTERNHKLLPGPLRSTPEKHLLNKAYQTCRKIYQNDNSQLEWAINYALDHTSSSKSYISFTSPAELTRFSQMAIALCPKSNWTISIQLLEQHTKQMADWRQAATGIQCKRGDTLKQTNRNPQGKAHLRLRHPNEDKMIAAVASNKQYSSNLAKHLFHMLWIMMSKA